MKKNLGIIFVIFSLISFSGCQPDFNSGWSKSRASNGEKLMVHRTREAFEKDYKIFTNRLSDPKIRDLEKQSLWIQITQKFGVDQEQIGLNPEELKWDGEKVVLKYTGPSANEISEEFIIETLEIEMVKIEPGTFLIGSPHDEQGRDVDEKQLQMTLTDAYWMGKHEVTQTQWEKLMGFNHSTFKNAGADAPVESVSWDIIQTFMKKLNHAERSAKRLPEGYEYGLPTEAQWEFACRAGTKGATYSDGVWEISATGQADALDAIAWYARNSAEKTSNIVNRTDWQEKLSDHTLFGPQPVGKKLPNAFGLHDMLGNVWEWCEDSYGHYPARPVINYSGPTGGAGRVIRGGAFTSPAYACRSAHRGYLRSEYASPSDMNDIGFRLCLRPILDRQ